MTLGHFVLQTIRNTTQIFRPGYLWALFSQNIPAELVLVPQDLRTVDPVLAQEFYGGVYSFAGRSVDTMGNSPFNLPEDWENTSHAWRGDLHGFRWLRHLQSLHNALANSHAQSLVGDWINHCGRPQNTIAWQPDIAAKRLMSWLSHSVIIVDQADINLYKKFLHSIGVHIQYLEDNLPDTPDGLPRLQVMLALAYAALCVRMQRSEKYSVARKFHDGLGKMLARQIFADGGHISRCPSVLPEILIDLLPLRQSYERLGIAPSQDFLIAIDRIIPAIRYYRHRDGNFARFNGVTSSQQELIATVLRYDDAMGEPTQEATQSGYQRLTGGPTTVIMDVGKPPKGAFSNNAHAGCLAFEMSSLRTCFVTNCGAPERKDKVSVAVSRSTAAHSTAVIHNTSSYRFQKKSMFRRHPGNRILAGPARVLCERKKLNGYTQIVARHDGYLRQFGAWHERILQLSDDGNKLFGRDRFFVQGENQPIKKQRDDCAIRFHLHPSVNARVEEGSGVISIHASENQVWKFTCDGGEVVLEESIFFASPGGPKPSSQIVIHLHLSQLSVVNWRFEQTIGTRLQKNLR